MANEVNTSPARRKAWLVYVGTLVVVGAVCVLLTALLMNIFHRKEEGRQYYFPRAELTEDTIEAEVWGRNFPSQYEGYLRTVDTQATRYGGSEAVNKLELDPRLVKLFAGYAFAVDYREERGHAHMLYDQDISKRTKPPFKQTGACLHCHSSVLRAYRKLGEGDTDRERVFDGFRKMCAMPLAEARKQVEHPVTCLDCHDPKTIKLRVTRPGFLAGIAALASGDASVPHLPSVERWRKDRGNNKGDYDPNVHATRQEMRSFVCGQCHVEYYFKGEGKEVTYPWHKGLKVEEIEGYYDDEKFSDWKHRDTGAALLKAQHPEFETWGQGMHARSGVACADCHMPYRREGAVKVSDHQVRSPLLNVGRACRTCHPFPEGELKARAEAIQDRTKALLDRAEDAVVELIDALAEARKNKVPEGKLEKARALHRKAQWRVDFVNAENSMGFHAAQESARVLAEAIDYARQGQVEVLRQGR
jgi:nitrite reductase (cytochrome c-552)